MFPSTPYRRREAPLGALARMAATARSILLLEDDHDVDWEVGEDEREPRRDRPAEHPHRLPFRPSRARRRGGQVHAQPQPCLSPLTPAIAGRALTPRLVGAARLCTTTTSRPWAAR